MAALPATPGLTNRKRSVGAPGFDLVPLSLADVDEALADHLGKRARRDRLERDDRAYRWVVRRAMASGTCTFRTTLCQAAAGMGFETTDDRRENLNRFGSTVHRAFRSLEALGLIDTREATTANGKTTCLEITLLNNGRQRSITESSVPQRRDRCGRAKAPRRRPLRHAERPSGPRQPGRRRPHRPPHNPARIFFDRSEVATLVPRERRGPLKGFPSSPKTPRSTHAREGRAAADPEENRKRAGSRRPDENSNGKSGSGEPGGICGANPGSLTEIAAALPEIELAFELIFGEPSRPYGRFEAQLLRALRRCDRYGNLGAGGPGLGVGVLVDLMAARAEDLIAGDVEVAPASIAYFAPELDSVSKAWRRQQKPRLRAGRRRKKDERQARARRSSDQQQEEP